MLLTMVGSIKGFYNVLRYHIFFICKHKKMDNFSFDCNWGFSIRLKTLNNPQEIPGFLIIHKQFNRVI